MEVLENPGPRNPGPRNPGPRNRENPRNVVIIAKCIDKKLYRFSIQCHLDKIGSTLYTLI